MRKARSSNEAPVKSAAASSSSSASALPARKPTSSPSSSRRQTSTSLKANGSSGLSNGTAHEPSSSSSSPSTSSGINGDRTARSEGRLPVGILPLHEGALEIGDDGRAIVWLDIDNTLYSKHTDIANLMTARIRAYIIGLGLEEEEAERLHQKYYKEYGLAIRGLVSHHKIDALDYDAKCDATLPLEDVLKPNEKIKAMIRDLDRKKCRVWALTNAYKTHAIRVLKLLDIYDQIEGVIYCDYAQDKFACKPEKEFYDAAMQIVGLQDPTRCYFVDDSQLNIRAAKRLGWGHCVLFDEQEESRKGEAKYDGNANGTLTPFDASCLSLRASDGIFDVQRIQREFRRLPQQRRVELLHIILDACLPGDIVGMTKTLEKHLRLTKDMISNLPEEICLRIFEKLEVRDLLNCRMASKKWHALAANPALWKSHALALTHGDPVGLIAPAEPSGWEPLVRGLYFRERNWSKGICQHVTLMQGHTGFVTAMKLKGRKTLVTGSYDETIRVWDLYTGVCKKVLTAKAIACLDFLSEEGVLAAGLYDTGRVMVWDMKTWTLLQTLSGHNRGIRNVALSAEYLVSVGQDKAIVVWDWKQGTKVVRFGQQSNVSLGVSIVDKDKIVAVTVDGIIRTFSIRSKEMIGQFDLTKLSGSLVSHLAGLKGGNAMMQWFAAHRNTITLASQNIVIHLKWQEHVVPVKETNSKTTARTVSVHRPSPRARSDSVTSSVSTASNATTRSTRSTAQKRDSLAFTTPTKVGSPPSMMSASQSSRSTSATQNRLMTPSRFQSPNTGSAKGSPTPLSPTPWPKPPRSEASLTPVTPAARGTDPDSPITPPEKQEKDKAQAAETRIAPNLGAPPLVVDVLHTPEAAAGCVDPAKRRVVLASRFSSRAGADRRIYTSTLDASSAANSKDSDAPPSSGENLERKVVPVGGAWQAQAEELATPSRNPMSIVLDHENCVVGTSEGLVYRMGFVGSEHSQGWIEEQGGEDSSDSTEKQAPQSDTVDGIDGTIIDLLQLRSAWKELFV